MSRSFLISLLCWGLFSCGSDAVPLTPLNPGTVVLAFGDSLTAGYGAPRNQSYPARLAEMAVLNVENAGVPGEVSADGLQRLPSVLSQYQPQLVILCHGGNDLLRSTGKATAKANLISMISLIRAQGAEVLLLGVPRPGIFLSTAEFYDEIAAETGVAYMPDVMTDVLKEASLKSDTVHPNAAGYQRIANAIQDYLITAGAL